MKKHKPIFYQDFTKLHEFCDKTHLNIEPVGDEDSEPPVQLLLRATVPHEAPASQEFHDLSLKRAISNCNLVNFLISFYLSLTWSMAHSPALFSLLSLEWSFKSPRNSMAVSEATSVPVASPSFSLFASFFWKSNISIPN